MKISKMSRGDLISSIEKKWKDLGYVEKHRRNSLRAHLGVERLEDVSDRGLRLYLLYLSVVDEMEKEKRRGSVEVELEKEV
jgi:hypothetical protein